MLSLKFDVLFQCSMDPLITSAIEDIEYLTQQAVMAYPQEDLCVVKNYKFIGSSNCTGKGSPMMVYPSLISETQVSMLFNLKMSFLHIQAGN